MHDAHVIGQMTLDASFGAVLTPQDAERRAADFVRGPVLRTVQEVFDACVMAEEHWRVDELVIDLGELPADRWEAEAADRLRDRLRQQLDDLRGPGGASAAARAARLRIRSRPQARLEKLLFYLQRGHMPGFGQGDDPFALARALVQDHLGELAEALRGIADRGTMLRRLAAQWDDSMLAALVHAWMPGAPAAASRLLDTAAQARTATRSAESRAALWEAVLDHAMAHAVAPRPAALMLLRSQVLAALDGGGNTLASDPLQALGHAWAPLLRDDRAWLKDTLQRFMGTPSQRERLVEALPDAVLPKLAGLWWSAPVEQAVSQWITAIVQGTPATAAVKADRQRRLWAASLSQAMRHDSATFDAVRFETAVRQDIVAPAAAPAPDAVHWFDRVARGATALLAKALHGLRLPWRKRGAPEPADAAPDAAPERLAAANAGLVLVSPYLPRLFAMLGLADERAFISPEAALRAARLLDYIATGATLAEEPGLTLDKLFCGLPLSAPLPREFEPSAAERNAVDGLLGAVIQHWAILGSTSAGGLRETFLRRSAHLSRKDDAWQLTVEPGPIDMLIDRLPWGYATVRHPWMKEVIHVDWR